MQSLKLAVKLLFTFVRYHLETMYSKQVFFLAADRGDDWTKDVDERIQYGVDYAKQQGFVKSGQQVICVTGWRQGAGSSNTVRIM